MLTCPIIKSILFTGSAKDNGIGMINTPHWVCMQKIETMNHILCYISKANYFCQKEIFMASHSPYGTLEKFEQKGHKDYRFGQKHNFFSFQSTHMPWNLSMRSPPKINLKHWFSHHLYVKIKLEVWILGRCRTSSQAKIHKLYP